MLNEYVPSVLLDPLGDTTEVPPDPPEHPMIDATRQRLRNEKAVRQLFKRACFILGDW